VPELPVALSLDDPPVEPFGRAGRDIASIDSQPLEYGLARSGKLLDGVHDLDLFDQSQMVQQCLVRVLVDARLVAAQIDRHAILFAVVQGRQQALAGSHGFGGSRHWIPFVTHRYRSAKASNDHYRVSCRKYNRQ